MRRTGKHRSRRIWVSVLVLCAGFILAGCDIAINQTASSGRVTVGEEITYTISGSDLDNQQAHNPTPPGEPPIPKEGKGYPALIGKANLPEGVEFVSARPTNTADGSFCAGPDANRVVRCFLPFRNDSESNSVNITVRATEPGMKTTTTSVFEEYLNFPTGTDYPVVVRSSDSGQLGIRVDPDTGLFLDPDVGRPLTNDENHSNNATSATTEVVPPSLRIGDARVSERSRNAFFTVSLSAASQQTTTVNYTTANGTAKAPADYATRRGALTFLPNQTAQRIAVPIKNDRRDEKRTEFFSVNLSGAAGATIADSSGRGTIVDNDR